MKETPTTGEVRAAVERLKALPGQDAEALELLLGYARDLHAQTKRGRELLADARAFALLQICFCEGGRKCERCRMIAEISKVMG